MPENLIPQGRFHEDTFTSLFLDNPQQKRSATYSQVSVNIKGNFNIRTLFPLHVGVDNGRELAYYAD